MNKLAFFISLVLSCAMRIGYAQETVDEPLVVDDIQIDTKSVLLSPAGDTATVDLFLISYQKAPREFKLNTFASGIVGSDGKPRLYASIQMGNVRVDLADKQNYLHYLLKQDEPVKLELKTAGWHKRWGKPQRMLLVFEDSSEQGKFLEVEVELK